MHLDRNKGEQQHKAQCRKKLAGKKALIVGTSSGTGLETARLFASEGARIALNARREEKLYEAAASISGGAVIVPGDVSVSEKADEVASQAIEGLGGLDIVVYAAGIVVPCPLKDLTLDDFAEHLRVNLTGNFAIVRAAALHMMENQGKNHTRGASYHPQTQGKIERWHQTLKNRILLENYYLPGDLEAQIDAFVGHYNHQRYHESLKNLTPADV